MNVTDVLNVLVGRPTPEISTVTCEADVSSSLAGASWIFTVTDHDAVDYTYQVYYVVDGVGDDPTLGVAEIDAITNRADAAGDLASKYFTINDGKSTSETAYYAYFSIDDVAGYQEYGLSAKTAESDTGLTPEATYYFKITINGGDQVEYSITCSDEDTITYAELLTLLNATGAGQAAVWAIVGGDLRCTSRSTAIGSAIALAAGATGTDLAGALTGFEDYEAAVARVTAYDPKLGQVEATNVTLRADSSADLNNKYWTLHAGLSDAAYYVWYAVAGETNTDPAPGGTGIRVDIVENEAVFDVCKKTAAAMNAVATSKFSVVQLGSTKIRVINLEPGAATNAADGDVGGVFAVSVVQAGVAAVAGLATKTLLGAIEVSVGDADGDVAAAMVTMLTAAGWTAAARAPANDHIVDVTHPTKGNCTNSADGNVGGAFAVGITTGVDPTASSTLISVAVAIVEDETNANVALKTRTALEAVSKMSLRALFSRSTAALTITNRRGGVVADTADVDTGWASFVKDQDGSATVLYNMGQDLATANYVYQPDEDKSIKIRQLIFSLADSAVTAGGSFGALAALTNGFNINICQYDGTVKKTLIGPIKTNSEVVSMGTASMLSTTQLNIVIDLHAMLGGAIPVSGSLGEYIECDVNDNLNGIDGMYLRAIGIVENDLG